MYARRGSETGELVVHIEPRELPAKKQLAYQPSMQLPSYRRQHLQLPPISTLNQPAANANVLHRMRSYDDAAFHSKPAKKARIGGAAPGFLARLLNGGSAGAQPVVQMPLPQPTMVA
jgi:hypothetical protein